MNFRRREKRSTKDEEPLPEQKFHPKRKRGPVTAGRLVLLLLVGWLTIIHYFERVRVNTAINKCQWHLWENWKGPQAEVTPHRIVLLADPQLVDAHTYPKLPSLVNYVLRKLSDNYLYINHHYMQARLDPDTTIFVGDLFDGGREWDDDVWFEEFERFNRIFPRKPNRRSYRSLPGNHDIGFQNISGHNLQRFAAFFGDPNDVYVLGNHSFVQIDTISLSHPDEAINSDARTFVSSVESMFDPKMPRIVLSHVPLYRDPKVEVCGPGREAKRPFPLQRGHQYQTVIDYSYTLDILAKVSPVIVFSGDDHDFCDMYHVDYQDNSRLLAREISCKTPSMTNGIKRPAYQLLSLNNPRDQTVDRTYETTMCYLPSPYFPLKVYAVCLLALFGILLTYIVYPERLDAFVSKPHVLPTLQSFVTTGDDRELRNRQIIWAAHCGVLFTGVLILLLLYHKM